MLVKCRKDKKKNLLKKVNKNSEWYYKTEKITWIAKKRQKICQEKVKIFVVNGHRVVAVNTTQNYDIVF